ncbi:hypothetical protein P7K49_040876 [Saguinus oedipus]|nr:hypothetical protein P7K49_040876 [Saguinus oedipus]
MDQLHPHQVSISDHGSAPSTPGEHLRPWISSIHTRRASQTMDQLHPHQVSISDHGSAPSTPGEHHRPWIISQTIDQLHLHQVSITVHGSAASTAGEHLRPWIISQTMDQLHPHQVSISDHGSAPSTPGEHHRPWISSILLFLPLLQPSAHNLPEPRPGAEVTKFPSSPDPLHPAASRLAELSRQWPQNQPVRLSGAEGGRGTVALGKQ